MSDNFTINIPHETTTSEAPSPASAEESNTAIAGDASASPRKFGGEFDTVEELEARYKELTEAKVEAKTEDPTPPVEDPTPEQVNEALSGKGLDVAAFEQEFSDKGELSADSYKKLAEAGFGKEMVDRYIQANSIIMDKLVSDMHSLAGGPEGYAAMSEWAKTTLDAKEIEAFNKATSSGDTEMIRFAVSGLYARYQHADGRSPELISGKAGTSSGVSSVFRSTAEVVAAMRDPRYGKDAAYTKDVEQRMTRSNVF